VYKVSILLLFLAVFSCAACSTNGSSNADPCNEEGTLFNDDFEGERDCGWVLYNGNGVATTIEDGVLRLSNSLSGEIAWANLDRSFDDTIVSVQARQISGPDDNAYGVICRYQSNENFYVFLISGDGHYAIGKYQSGEVDISYLTENGQYVFSDVINQGAAANEIRASCVGNQLSLAINGIPLETVTDTTFVRGDIGLGASTFQPGTTVIEFDDIRAIAP
jgi:hypothetical protein